MDTYRAWRFAELCWRTLMLSTFVAACTDDEGRAREVGRLAGQAVAADPADLEAVQEIVWTLAEWAEDLAGHPHRPVEPRPDEADRQVRDHVKDVLREQLSTEARDWMSGTLLHLDVTFLVLRDLPMLDSRAREDAFYAYGRATMALDLGHREAAERELERLRELRNTYAQETHNGTASVANPSPRTEADCPPRKRR